MFNPNDESNNQQIDETPDRIQPENTVDFSGRFHESVVLSDGRLGEYSLDDFIEALPVRLIG